MRKHIIISFDTDKKPNEPLVIENLVVSPADAPISKIDLEMCLSHSVPFISYMREIKKAMIVSGSRAIEDTNLVEALLSEMTKSVPYGQPITLILNSTPGPTFMATQFARLHNHNIHKITPDWDTYNKLAGGICALDMLEALEDYDDKSVLLIWDEESTEVPYFFEPTLAKNIPLYVYSTKSNSWMSTEWLQDTIDNFHERVESARLKKERRDAALATKTDE